jgi:hypothetical protein
MLFSRSMNNDELINATEWLQSSHFSHLLSYSEFNNPSGRRAGRSVTLSVLDDNIYELYNLSSTAYIQKESRYGTKIWSFVIHIKHVLRLPNKIFINYEIIADVRIILGNMASPKLSDALIHWLDIHYLLLPHKKSNYYLEFIIFFQMKYERVSLQGNSKLLTTIVSILAEGIIIRYVYNLLQESKTLQNDEVVKEFKRNKTKILFN